MDADNKNNKSKNKSSLLIINFFNIKRGQQAI